MRRNRVLPQRIALLLAIGGVSIWFLSARHPLSPEIELFESVLRQQWGSICPADGGTYYLTCTPSSDWRWDARWGGWEDMPNALYRRIADMPIVFQKATDAVLTGGCVRGERSGESGFMVWIAVKRWISETEVEVETGTWHEPLWGNGRTAVYIKVDGEWRFRRSLDGWIT